jgi:hypothetical protein
LARGRVSGSGDPLKGRSLTRAPGRTATWIAGRDRPCRWSAARSRCVAVRVLGFHVSDARRIAPGGRTARLARAGCRAYAEAARGHQAVACGLYVRCFDVVSRHAAER